MQGRLLHVVTGVGNIVSCPGLQDLPEDLSLPWRWLVLFSVMVARNCRQQRTRGKELLQEDSEAGNERWEVALGSAKAVFAICRESIISMEKVACAQKRDQADYEQESQKK